jgi:hypothetical protein
MKFRRSGSIRLGSWSLSVHSDRFGSKELDVAAVLTRDRDQVDASGDTIHGGQGDIVQPSVVIVPAGWTLLLHPAGTKHVL